MSAFKVPNMLKDPFLFESVLNRQEEIFSGDGVMDLAGVSFIEPYSMLSLLILGRNYLRRKGEQIKLTNIPLPIHQYLNRMDFFDTKVFKIESRLDGKYSLKRRLVSSRVIEIIEIPNKERESLAVINSVIALFRKRAAYILKYWMQESVVDYFVTVISELCQNIFEHSMDSGYLSMQTYTLGKENVFRLAISDSGIGIKESFSGNQSVSYASDADLIALALTKPISSKRPYGFGLCQVNNIIKQMEGSIYIRSGDASVTTMYGKRQNTAPIFLKNNLSGFQGTQISISLFA